MSKYITVTRDGRVAAPVYGGLDERGALVRGTPLRAMHQHPGSIPLYLIKTTNTPSTLNQHPFVLIEARVSIRIAARRIHVSDAISSTGGPSGVGRKGGRERNSRRSREMLLMPRGQRDKHARETSSCRFVPVFVWSCRARMYMGNERRKTLIRDRKTHAAM